MAALVVVDARVFSRKDGPVRRPHISAWRRIADRRRFLRYPFYLEPPVSERVGDSDTVRFGLVQGTG